MKKEIAEKWVAALRSGEYEQGSGMLRKVGYKTNEERTETTAVDKFCCLGVLCDIHRLESTEGEWDELKYRGARYTTPEGNYLPPAVIEWAGICGGSNPSIVERGEGKHLANLNDEGCTFEYLANRIEDQWPTI